MPLVAEGRFVADDWTYAESPVAGAHRLIVPAQALLGAPRPFVIGPDELGALIDQEADVRELVALFDAVCLFAIRFDATGDGRGFSLAAQLRRHGFRGALRARGPLIADQYVHLRGAGFDAVEIDEERATRHPESEWLRAWGQFANRYQTTAGRLRSIVAARHEPGAAAGPVARVRRVAVDP